MFDDYDEISASRGSGFTNGDYIVKITAWNPNYMGRDGQAKKESLSVGFEVYANTDGVSVPKFDFNHNFFIYEGQGSETPGYAINRQISMRLLKQLMFSIEGRELTKDEFVAMLSNRSHWLTQLVGARIVWTERYASPSVKKDPTYKPKANITVDRYFKPQPVEGKMVGYDGKAVGEYSEAYLTKSNREALFNSNKATVTKSFTSPVVDDEIPF